MQKKHYSYFLILLLGPALSAPAQDKFEVGGLALASSYRSAEVRSGLSVGAVGFQPGPSGGGLVGQMMNDLLGGEVRYLWAHNKMKLSSGGRETEFSGRSHLVNYDFLLYAASRGARVRPYAAAGGGLKIYQGTGTEQAFQPLSSLALLTKTNETLPVVDFGGGIKFQAAPHFAFRVEFRDYITKVPKVFAASPGARISGIFHQWAPAFGASWTF